MINIPKSILTKAGCELRSGSVPLFPVHRHWSPSQLAGMETQWNNGSEAGGLTSLPVRILWGSEALDHEHVPTIRCAVDTFICILLSLRHQK